MLRSCRSERLPPAQGPPALARTAFHPPPQRAVDPSLVSLLSNLYDIASGNRVWESGEVGLGGRLFASLTSAPLNHPPLSAKPLPSLYFSRRGPPWTRSNSLAPLRVPRAPTSSSSSLLFGLPRRRLVTNLAALRGLGERKRPPRDRRPSEHRPRG